MKIGCKLTVQSTNLVVKEQVTKESISKAQSLSQMLQCGGGIDGNFAAFMSRMSNSGGVFDLGNYDSCNNSGNRHCKVGVNSSRFSIPVGHCTQGNCTSATYDAALVSLLDMTKVSGISGCLENMFLFDPLVCLNLKGLEAAMSPTKSTLLLAEEIGYELTEDEEQANQQEDFLSSALKRLMASIMVAEKKFKPSVEAEENESENENEMENLTQVPTSSTPYSFEWDVFTLLSTVQSSASLSADVNPMATSLLSDKAALSTIRSIIADTPLRFLSSLVVPSSTPHLSSNVNALFATASVRASLSRTFLPHLVLPSAPFQPKVEQEQETRKTTMLRFLSDRASEMQKRRLDDSPTPPLFCASCEVKKAENALVQAAGWSYLLFFTGISLISSVILAGIAAYNSQPSVSHSKKIKVNKSPLLKFLNCFNIPPAIRSLFASSNKQNQQKSASVIHLHALQPPPPTELPVIHGLRALSFLWVILGHAFAFLWALLPMKNMEMLMKDVKQPWFTIIPGGFYAVDTFFVLSGFLFSYLAIVKFRKSSASSSFTPLPIFSSIVLRYIRLTPLLLFSLLFYIGIGASLNADGPLWNDFLKSVNADACAKYWWRDLLYVSTLFPSSESCVQWSWYMSNEFIYFIAALFIMNFWLWDAHKDKQLKKKILLTQQSEQETQQISSADPNASNNNNHVAETIVAPFLPSPALEDSQNQQKRPLSLFGLTPLQWLAVAIPLSAVIFNLVQLTRLCFEKQIKIASMDIIKNMSAFYFKPHMRMAPYMIGLLTGMLVGEKRMAITAWFLKNTSIRWILHCVVLASMAAIVIVIPAIANAEQGDKTTSSFSEEFNFYFQGSCRALWGLCISYIIVSSGCGWHMRAITTFLSSKLFVPLSKLSFVCYMTHCVIIYLGIALFRAELYYQTMIPWLCFFVVTFVTLIVSFFVFLFIESPIAKLVDLYLMPSSASLKSSSPTTPVKDQEKEEKQEIELKENKKICDDVDCSPPRRPALLNHLSPLVNNMSSPPSHSPPHRQNRERNFQQHFPVAVANDVVNGQLVQQQQEEVHSSGSPVRRREGVLMMRSAVRRNDELLD
eukprot:GDKJ01018411.1.p1 GENE.GDKJ01018411.1~~GDKJ01018411.1.p1  ORF type:complete len:1176 (-),score=261.88 GDKJ01018411.1:472-3708(-)